MKKGDRALRIVLWISIALLIGLYIFDPTVGISNSETRLLAKMTILRIAVIPAIVCCVILLRLQLTTRPRKRDLLFFLPAIAVALNNIPWLALATGSATLRGSAAIWLLVAQVLGVAVMEEFAFRGILFPLLWKRLGRTKKGMWLSIFLSSAIFGVIHFANLIESPNLSATLMQVGYSTLIGALCAVLLLGTGNIWYCVAVHAVFNFGGGLVSYFADGTIWNLPTVLCTAFVSVAVFGWYLYLTLKFKPDSLPTFRKENNQEQEGAKNV